MNILGALFFCVAFIFGLVCMTQYDEIALLKRQIKRLKREIDDLHNRRENQ